MIDMVMKYLEEETILMQNEAFGGKDKNGQPLSSGTYYYVIDLQNGDDVFKGTVTIMR